MQKKTDEQLGRLLTHEIVSMIQDKNLKDADVGLLIRAIIGFKTIKQGYLASFANSLKSGFIEENRKYIDGINKRRERNRNAEARRREKVAQVDENTHMSAHVRPCPRKEKGKEKKYIPLPPKGGKGEKIPKAISPDEILGEGVEDPEKWADEFAEELGKWYPYEVNQDGLRKILIGKAKKNLRRALEQGLEAWIDSGAWSEQRFMPQDIVKWIKLERFLDKPPEKKTPAARESDVPTADETSAVLADEGE